MRFTLTILALSLLLTSCSQRDARFRQQIVGCWTREGGKLAWNFTSAGSWFFSDNMKPGQTNSLGGTWQIQNRVLTMTITNSPITSSNSQIGHIVQYRIVHLDDHQFVYDEDGGEMIRLNR
jgi:hypothetical protein